jgi:hypothetical protein
VRVQDEEDAKEHGGAGMVALSLDAAGDRLVHHVLAAVPSSPPASQVRKWSGLSTAGGTPPLGYPGWACGVSGAASRQLVVPHRWGIPAGRVV